MQRTVLRLAAGVVAAGLLSGCGGSSRVEMPARMTSGTASAKVNAFIARDTPTASDLTGLQLEETTPDGAFEKLGVQTFRVTEDLYQFETFAVTPTETIKIGSGLDGPGITEMRLTDLDGNDGPDLVFTSGTGRGNKQYSVGVLDRPGYEPAPDPEAPATSPVPLRVRNVRLTYRDPLRFEQPGKLVEVWDDQRNVKLGTLRLSGDQRDSIVFVADAEIPAHIRRRFLEPRM